MTTSFRCGLCGKWHVDGSDILKRHIHTYYQSGGTISLDRWESSDSEHTMSRKPYGTPADAFGGLDKSLHKARSILER